MCTEVNENESKLKQYGADMRLMLNNLEKDKWMSHLGLTHWQTARLPLSKIKWIKPGQPSHLLSSKEYYREY